MTPDQAYAAGRSARSAGLPSTTCPHRAAAAELRTAWVRGWLDQRRADLYGALLEA